MELFSSSLFIKRSSLALVLVVGIQNKEPPEIASTLARNAHSEFMSPILNTILCFQN
ncbi:hypothetical protein HanIR_Chr15g0744041 [Helianthus annuus]|nr:hypothetical protein HanIR_Chr15g0744041 [Helianthus annuus]